MFNIVNIVSQCVGVYCRLLDRGTESNRGTESRNHGARGTGVLTRHRKMGPAWSLRSCGACFLAA